MFKISDFLETGEKLEGFRMLKSRIRNHQKRIVEDVELIERFLRRV